MHVNPRQCLTLGAVAPSSHRVGISVPLGASAKPNLDLVYKIQE